MENSNLLETVNLDSLGSVATTLANDSSFDSLDAIANLRDNYTGSGSGIPQVTEDLETVSVSALTAESDVFNLAVHSYIGSDELTDFSAAVSSFSEYVTEQISEVVNPDAMEWETTTVADNSLLTEAVSIALDHLEEFQEDSEFLNKLEIAFGEDIIADEAMNAIESIISGEATTSLEIVKIANLDANAAFASTTNTIYLSEDFLEQNEANPDNVANVIIEEWGHYLDNILNETDSAGDEGEIFASLVKDFNFDLDALQTEDDTTILNIGGEDVLVEQATDAFPLTTSWTGFRHTNGGQIWFKRDGTVSALTDIWIAGKTFENLPAPINLENQFSITTRVSNTTMEIKPDGTIGFRSGFIKPYLTVISPSWTRIS